jgi:hypothetical protein
VILLNLYNCVQPGLQCKGIDEVLHGPPVEQDGARGPGQGQDVHRYHYRNSITTFQVATI